MQNIRAHNQYKIISQHLQHNKKIIDLGCGYHNLLYLLHRQNHTCVGVDKDCNVVPQSGLPYTIICQSIEDFISSTDQHFDVSICFSVLPYLQSPTTILQWMRINSSVAFVECQYSGDGPGFDFIKGDRDMRDWLQDIGWQQIKPIGKTFIKDRSVHRTIWRCE